MGKSAEWGTAVRDADDPGQEFSGGAGRRTGLSHRPAAQRPAASFRLAAGAGDEDLQDLPPARLAFLLQKIDLLTDERLDGGFRLAGAGPRRRCTAQSAAPVSGNRRL